MGASRLTRALLAVTRIWLPLAIAVAGVVMIVLGHGRTRGTGATSLGNSIAAGGVALLITALIVWMINWLFRMSVTSNRDREREEEARRYFSAHGRWPDDERG
jgi:drug/metabolite transporter (DMT)-like permease